MNDLGEVLSLQGRAADQTAVDLALRHQTLAVLRIHGAAVLDAHIVRRIAVSRANRLTDDADGLIRLLVGRGQTGSDCPGSYAMTTLRTSSAVKPDSAISVW